MFFSVWAAHTASRSIGENGVSLRVHAHNRIPYSFLTPSSFLVIGDRALDTVIGSLICVGCSYFLPWWEARFMPSLARAAVAANRGTSLRTAAYIVACERILQARQLRGLYP